ncbi:MAG: hypothetical protein KAI45_05800 [Melioribacteraceae bacterium]|nr:hypothetical protein [Melioribacteraceae bacterium]
MKFFLLLGFIIFILDSTNAQSSKNDNSHKENSQHILHHNHVAIFLGSTTFFKKGESHFSVGLDYVYRPNVEKPWAFSIFGEAIFAEYTEYLVGLPVYYSFNNIWWLRAGPGIEVIQEEEHHGDEVETKTEVEFLFRFGVGVPIHLGNFGITPSIDFDLVRNHDAIVWGFNFGYGF